MTKTVEFNIELIIDEYTNYVYKVIDNLAGKELTYEDKEEIISDTFYLLWKNQDKINTNLKSYLATIARNCTYNRLKKNRKELAFDEHINTTYTMDIDDLIIMKNRLKRLKMEELELFELYYIKGLKVREIAKKLSKKISTVKVELHRIRKKLKEETRL